MERLKKDESWVYGYAFSGRAGVGPDAEVKLAPLTRVNFLVGRNNHGKSTLLRAAEQWTTKRQPEGTKGRRKTLVPVQIRGLRAMFQACGINDPAAREKRLQEFEPIDAHNVGVWVDLPNDSRSNAVIDRDTLSNALRNQMGLTSYSTRYPNDPWPHESPRV